MIEEIFHVACLAVLQGITEFLPVSSSGHLALADRLLGVKTEAALVSVVLHAGTLAAVIKVFWQDLLALLRPDRRRLLAQVLAATAMVGVVGLSLEALDAERLLFEGSLLIPGTGFLVTALLLRCGLSHQSQQHPADRIPWPAALRIGVMQVVAILPGISRSGATITSGLRHGLKRDDAATFSFLLMVPAVAGASGVKLLTVWFSQPGVHGESLAALTVGFVVAGVVGYAAINTLLRSVGRGNFLSYSWYCAALGGVTLAFAGRDWLWPLLGP